MTKDEALEKEKMKAWEDCFRFGQSIMLNGQHISLNNITVRQSMENNPQTSFYIGRRFDD